MSQFPPPPPPPSHDTQPGRSRTMTWKFAIALTAIVGLVSAAAVFAVMDARISDLEDDLEAARQQQEDQEDIDAETASPLDGLGDLLGDLAELDDLDDLLGMGDLPDDGLDGVDPMVLECLSPTDLDLGLGDEGSIPDSDIETQVDAIRDIVADERGLTAESDLDIEFAPLEQVQRRAVELTEEDMDDETAAVETRLLAALGAIEPHLDLAQAQLDAVDAGVGGFYDPDTTQLVIGSEELDGMGAYITSHEMVHALADATLGLPDTAALAESDGSDAAYAALNAIEGDATLYGQMFVSAHVPVEELLALGMQSAEAEAAMDAIPHFVRRALEFPYVEGMTFSCAMYLDGGWSAVDKTYSELPTTTAQILFPDRYRSGEEAVDVRTPDGPSGWDEIHTDTFGAADLLFLLEAPGGDPAEALDDPADLVEGWAGGEVTVWDRTGETAVAVIMAEHHNGPPLCDTVADYYDAAFPEAGRRDEPTGMVFEGGDQSAVIRCGDGEVALGIGPDTDTAHAAIS